MRKVTIKFRWIFSLTGFTGLTEIASKYAVPWYRKLGIYAHELTQTSKRWYKEY